MYATDSTKPKGGDGNLFRHRLSIFQFEILKTIGNSTHIFYKKCDTNKEQKQQLDPSPLTPYVQLGQTKKEVKLAQARCNLSKPTNPKTRINTGLLAHF